MICFTPIAEAVYTTTTPILTCIETHFFTSALNAVNYAIIIGIVVGILWKILKPL